MTSGEKMVKLLKDRGLGQADLVRATGLDRSKVSRWATNKQPMRLPEIEMVARFLGCDLRDIANDDPDGREALAHSSGLVTASLTNDQKTFLDLANEMASRFGWIRMAAHLRKMGTQSSDGALSPPLAPLKSTAPLSGLAQRPHGRPAAIEHSAKKSS